MIRVLVVDDDTSICDHISRKVKIELDGNVKVYQAYSGKDALAIISAKDIDIIFSDIKMPFFTGIDLLQSLNAINFSGYTIMISGYDDYNLVRKAMKLGATDYLLKPIDSDEFSNVLNNCSKKIIKGKEGSPVLSVSEKNQLQYVFYNQYMLSILLNEKISDFKIFYEKYGKTKNDGAMLIIFENKGVKDFSWEKNQTDFFYRIRKSISLYLGLLASEIILGEKDGRWVILFFLNENTKIKEIKLNLDSFLYNIKKEYDFNVSISEKPFFLKNIYNEYGNVLKNLSSLFYDLNDYGEKIEETKSQLLKNSIIEAANCNFEKYSINTHKWLVLCSIEKTPIEDIKESLINTIYEIMVANNKFIKIISRHKFSSLDITSAIQGSNFASSLKSRLNKIMEIYILEVNKEIDTVLTDGNIGKAKQYIKENYNKEITIKEVSNYLNLHPNYLSTIFKEQTGQTYSQYLRKIRIDKAKHLIKNTNKKLYEIANEVGYKDSSHFHRAFKEETEMSPGRFRNS